MLKQQEVDQIYRTLDAIVAEDAEFEIAWFHSKGQGHAFNAKINRVNGNLLYIATECGNKRINIHNIKRIFQAGKHDLYTSGTWENINN